MRLLTLSSKWHQLSPMVLTKSLFFLVLSITLFFLLFITALIHCQIFVNLPFTWIVFIDKWLRGTKFIFNYYEGKKIRFCYSDYIMLLRKKHISSCHAVPNGKLDNTSNHFKPVEFISKKRKLILISVQTQRLWFIKVKK